tara:strand:+ start:354 stop:581 length:228 start_codon:yes stop_codon:yes gene_type:complete
MFDVLLMANVAAVCQDGVTREGGTVLIRDAQYVFIDADGEVLEGDRAVVEIAKCNVMMSPEAFTMLVKKHGPILN